MATGNSALATVATPQAREVIRFDAAQRQMIRDMYARGSSDSEFAALMTVAEARGLDPRLQQCHFVKRYDSKLEREVWAVQVSIDGLRSQAESTGDYDGQDEPEFIAEAGVIVAARVRVWRKSISRPFVGVAYFDEYVQTKNVSVFDPATKKNVTTKAPTTFWVKMRRTMLAKCAEALAIRKGFPHTAGLYTPEEMGQAENDRPERAQVEVVVSSADPQLGGGDDEGYTRLIAALAGETLPVSKERAADLWIEHCVWRENAPPLVRPENGALAQSTIVKATRTVGDDPRTSAFGSTAAFTNAVKHSQYRVAHENYAALTGDVVECTTPEQIAHAWMDHADALAALPADAHAFALAFCGSRVSACEGGPKQGQAWLKKRIAELGGTPPEKPTRGPTGKNATGDHAVATIGNGAASTSASESAPTNTVDPDPEREAIATESASAAPEADAAYRLASLQQAWTDGEVTLETWRAHLASKDAVPAVANSFAANVHKFGRAAEASPYRGVACDRLGALGVPEFERGAVLDIAVKERAAKSASKAAA
jgi:phage recombination protein Bet